MSSRGQMGPPPRRMYQEPTIPALAPADYMYVSDTSNVNTLCKVPLSALSAYFGGGGGSGTVTSINGASSASGFTLTGGPITTAGTLTFNISNAANARTSLGLGAFTAGPLARSIGGSFEKQTGVIDAGVTTVSVAVPFAGTIISWQLDGNVSGSAVVRVLKNDSVISASAHPSVTANNQATGSTLTGWTTTFVAGDFFNFYLESASDFNRLSISLMCEQA